MTTRIIFLDIDGVLNSMAFYDRCRAAGERTPCPPLDPEAAGRLTRLVWLTGAQVVISSTWRGNPDLPGWLRAAGYSGGVLGETPRIDHGDRGDEIAAWIAAWEARGCSPVERLVILDDADDMGPLLPHLVQTNFRDGLQDRHVDEVIARLGRIQPNPRPCANGEGAEEATVSLPELVASLRELVDGIEVIAIRQQMPDVAPTPFGFH